MPARPNLFYIRAQPGPPDQLTVPARPGPARPE